MWKLNSVTSWRATANRSSQDWPRRITNLIQCYRQLHGFTCTPNRTWKASCCCMYRRDLNDISRRGSKTPLGQKRSFLPSTLICLCVCHRCTHLGCTDDCGGVGLNIVSTGPTTGLMASNQLQDANRASESLQVNCIVVALPIQVFHAILRFSLPAFHAACKTQKTPPNNPLTPKDTVTLSSLKNNLFATTQTFANSAFGFQLELE